MQVFAFSYDVTLAEQVCTILGVPLGRLEERQFEDGEHKTRPLCSVRGRDVFLLDSLAGGAGLSVNDRLCRLLFLVGALRDASAARITLVAPYLCYMRKDRRTKPRDPTTTRYVAQLLEAMGIDCVLTVDVHNLQAFQNAFRCPSEHLQATHLFAAWLARLKTERLAVMSPDTGGFHRADRLRRVLETQGGCEIPLVFMEKTRSQGQVAGEAVVGDVSDRTVVVVDDLICSGATLLRAATACRRNGARRVVVAATHGVLGSGANQVLADPVLDTLLLTNSIAPLRVDNPTVLDKLVVLDMAPLLAEAILRLHRGGSIVELTEGAA